jgi:PAS domain S-box-containing protein
MASTPQPGQAAPAIDFSRVFDSAPGLFMLLQPDPRFTVLAVSDLYLHATFSRREDIVGRSLFEVFTDQSDADRAVVVASVRALLEHVVATKTRAATSIQRYDVRRPQSEGGDLEERHWKPRISPVLGDDGELLYIVYRVDDATELVRLKRKEQEERAMLAEANARFQAIYDQGLFAGHLDLDGNVIDVNRSCLETCGFERADVIGKPFWECGWWNRSEQVQAAVQSAILQAVGGEPFHGESTYFWADGTERVVDLACIPIKDGAGDVSFVVATGLDITERVTAENNLRAMNILDGITEGFFAFDRDWRFTYVNRAAEQLIGQRARDMVGKTLWDVFPGLVGSVFETGYRRAMNERRAFMKTDYYPDHDRWYDVHAYPTVDGLSIYFRDVSEQKRVERERESLAAESEKRRLVYDAALSSTPDLVYVFDLDHRFICANEALLQLWGRTREDALGKTCLELGYEPWHAEMHDREIDRVIETKLPLRGEVPFTGTQGRRIYDYIFVPVLGPAGEVVAVAGTTRDVTDRQRDEQALREQAERLREVDRAKDEFLATLSHELRNPLAPLRNSIALLRMTSDDTTTAPIHEMMERQVSHLVRLVDDLLETSRLTRGTFVLRKERVEAAAIIRNALEAIAPAVERARHRLSCSLPKDPLWIDGDPVRLGQILGNLLDNAVKYTNDGGTIHVSLRREDDRAAITVRDTGAGIAPDALPRVFEMFSRGERASGRSPEGLGIGLALARRLSQMHGGTLDAQSDGLGRGSEFTVRLPLVDGAIAGDVADAQTETALPQKRILVVDDNRDAADSLGMMLELLGADVHVARDGQEALDAFAAYKPAVVLLDIGMPGIDGYEVARTLRDRFPEHSASIVALTGWGQDSDRVRAREAGFDHHLIKPAEIGALEALLGSLPH